MYPNIRMRKNKKKKKKKELGTNRESFSMNSTP